jgi:glucose-1-phosphate thymidylyltransferase
MKGLILSGGRGTRLRPITHTSAKQLVPVANKPILFYGIEYLRDAGIRQIGIIVGDTAEEIKAAVGTGDRWGIEITYIRQEQPLGLAHAVKIAEPFMDGDSFIMYLGDNLVKEGVTPFVQEFEARTPDAQILLAHVRNPQEFGVAELDGERVCRLVEKPAEPKSDLALVGVYLFSSCIFDAVKAIQPSKRGELEITDAIQYLIDQGKTVNSKVVQGWWKDTGKLEDMLEANRIMLDMVHPHCLGEVDAKSQLHGKIAIDERAQIINSEIRGPAVIGAGCYIEDAFIGPFSSIGDGVRIVRSEIEHSIVLSDSSILDVDERVADSLIGRNVTVRGEHRRPRVYRLMLGDSSEVSLV